MPIPLTPPAPAPVFGDPERLSRIIAVRQHLNDTRYLHWDQLRHRPAPEPLDHEEWWAALKLTRSASYRELPFRDRHGQPFVLGICDRMLELLHGIDTALGDVSKSAYPIATKETHDRYIVSSLMEEAITSSQMEGASTTRQAAIAMLRSGATPSDNSQRMIFNNYHAMEFIRSHADSPLAPSMVLELHRIVTRTTMDDADAGRLQNENETRVTVISHLGGKVLHAPPAAAELPARLELLCEFANGRAPYRGFMHPIIRAILLHFMLAYDHPFVDGNGRTARALFYWGLLHRGYRLGEFLSISRIIRKAHAQYRDAFLHTETDDNDTTYFVLHQLNVIDWAIRDLHAYLARKQDEMRQVESLMRDARNFNHRQRALLGHAVRHPGFVYTFESHSNSHKVVLATARTDLLGLLESGLLEEIPKRGHARAFRAPGDIAERLQAG